MRPSNERRLATRTANVVDSAQRLHTAARCLRCSTWAHTPVATVPLWPPPPLSTSMPPRRMQHLNSRRSCHGLTESPYTASTSAMAAAAPRISIGRHTARSSAQPLTNAVIARTPPARRTAPKSTKLMIPDVGTNPPATQTPDEGR
ncbi:hypothetical protein ZWY2020_000341 [Hordeum vulgare]|nr:hypothetical protein ZWY2020_000341 [Hordeum vulgare]